MRLTHWRSGPAEPLLPVDQAPATPAYLPGGDETLTMLAASLYGGGRGAQSAAPEELSGEIVVDDAGQTLQAHPGQAAAPDAPADQLVIDAAHLEPSWRWLAAVGPGDAGQRAAQQPSGDGEARPSRDGPATAGAGLVHTWLRTLLEGQGGTPSADQLRRQLGEIDQLLAEAEAREQSALPQVGQSTPSASAQAATDLQATARATSEAERQGSAALRPEAAGYASAFSDLRSELAAVEADLAATDQTLAEAADEARRADETGLHRQRTPSVAELSQLTELFDQLQRAVRHRDEAQSEAVAAANTAEVVRHAAARARSSRFSWIAQLQPVLLGLSASLVIVGVIQLVRGRNTLGLALGVTAILSATLAFLLPSRSSRGTPGAEQLESRATQADDDQARWQVELQRRSLDVSRLSGQLELPAQPGEADVARFAEQLAAWRRQREQTDGLAHDGEVAKNTSSAAIHRRADLQAQRADLQARLSELEGNWAAWCRTQGLPASCNPEDVLAGAAPAEDVLTDAAELRQARQGLLDQLGRLYWEADRLALARWMLHRAAPAIADAEPGARPAPPVQSSAADSGRDGLGRRASELLSSARGRALTVAFDQQGRPVLSELSEADGKVVPLDEIDAPTRAIVAMSLRVAAAERAAEARWPVLVRAPGTTGPVPNTSPLAVLLAELAHQTQVLVVTDAPRSVPGDNAGSAETAAAIHLPADPAALSRDAAAGAETAAAGSPAGVNGDRASEDIRVLVTPTE